MMNLAEWPEDQWWYWTDEWQAGEQQITEDRAAGRRGPVFASGDEFLAALREAAAIDGAVDSSGDVPLTWCSNLWERSGGSTWDSVPRGRRGRGEDSHDDSRDHR